MDLALLLSVFLSIIYVAIAFLSISRSANQTSNKLFALFTLLIAFWSLFSFLEDEPFGYLSEVFLRFEFATSLLIGLSFLFFSIHFPKKVATVPSIFPVAASIFSISIALLCFTPFVITNVHYNNGIQFTDGLLAPLFEIVLVLNFLGAAIILFRKYKSLNYTEKQQSLYLVFGVSISAAIAIIFNLVIAELSFFSGKISRVGIYGNMIMVVAISYAIAKHRLLDIKLVVARTVAYSLLLTIVAVFYIGTAVILSSTLLKTTTSTAQLIEFTILTIIVAFTFQPLRKFLERSTDKIFFKGDYDSNQLLSALTKVMAETILIDDIAHNLLKHLISEMRISRGAFVLTDGGKIFVSETQGYSSEPTFSEKDVFSLQALDKNLVFEDLDEGPAKDLLRKLDITIAIPLKTQVDHVGILLLGEKASGEIYSGKDIKVLEIFTPEAAISFENAKSVEKIRRFNITLKEQVERATKDLKDANEQLKELDKLKDEFLSVASHDLRTPMTAIKGYLWMAINGRAGKIENDALKRYLDISYSSAERMISLINDLLNVSRIKAGRMQMVFEQLDIKPIMDQVFAEIMSKATEKQIELKYVEDSKIPKVIIDKQRIPEVLQNLIGNAIKFTPEKGKITVTSKLSKEKGFVEIAVSDTGVGLSKEDSGKLFAKYGRIEHSYSAAKTTGGTGLGLYITKNYVEMHGGKIWVESEVGKGTTFIFTLHVEDEVTLKKMNAENQEKPQTVTVPEANSSIAKEASKTTIPVG